MRIHSLLSPKCKLLRSSIEAEEELTFVRQSLNDWPSTSASTLRSQLPPPISPRGRWAGGEGECEHGSSIHTIIAGLQWIALAVTAELSLAPNPIKLPHPQQIRCSLNTERLTPCPSITLPITHLANHPPYPLTHSPSSARLKGAGGESAVRAARRCSWLTMAGYPQVMLELAWQLHEQPDPRPLAGA